MRAVPASGMKKEAAMPRIGEKTIGELASELMHELRALFRHELELFTAEAKEKIANDVKDNAVIGLGGFLIYSGYLVLLAALVLGFTTFMPAWGAALLVAASLILTGFVLAKKGRKDLTKIKKTLNKRQIHEGDRKMGENSKIKEQSATDQIREQIQHTESNIIDTVHTIAQRLSPQFLRQRGAHMAKRLAWQGMTNFLDLAQRTSVQAALVGGCVFWIMIRNRKDHKTADTRHVVPAVQRASTASKALGTSALWIGLWLLQRNDRARKEEPARKSALSEKALAATAAKEFLRSGEPNPKLSLD
jgi:hypothetical protein